jgi:PAS domain S-box-containing protein
VSAARTGRFRKPLVGYLVAIAAVTLALVIREALSVLTGPDFPEYVLFYPTVMTVALLLGVWPSLVSILTAAGLLLLARSFTWLRPPVPADSSSYLGLVLFVGVCVFLSFVAEAYRRSRVKAEAYDREEALRDSQKALRRQAELLRLSFDAIIVWRMGGEIESWNNGAEDLYGFPESEALGRTIHELRKTMHDRPWTEVEGILKERGHWQGEARHVARDGRELVVSSRLHIGGDPDGQVRVLEIDRDITEQKRVQEELKRAHDELEEKVQKRTIDLQKANRTLLMVSACDQALVQISEEKELISVICQIIQDEGGYPLVWVGLTGAGNPGGLECVASAGARDGILDATGQDGSAPAAFEGPPDIAARTGEPVVIEDIAACTDASPWRENAREKGFIGIAALPLVSARREVFGVLVIYSETGFGFKDNQLALLKEIVDDLAFGVMSLRARAERDQAQRDLEQKAAQLRVLTGEIVRVEQRERQRIARLLHDQFQQLLAAALYGVAALNHEMPQVEFKDGTGKLNSLLRECIALSRSLTSELGHPALSDPDLRSGLEWLAAWMMEKHGLQVLIAPGDTVVIAAEETRAMLMQATRELLFNVVKHAGVKSARVSVERSAQGRITITVSDEGAGFDTRSLFTAGTTAGGVGLFSIRERLALSGGGIDIQSFPGKGSRFTVWISDDPGASMVPAGGPSSSVAPGTARESGGPAALGPRTGPRLRVLIVDDHALVREGLALQIRQQPDLQIVGEAADGETAVQLAERLRPDVVTMDLSLPGIDGIEAARRIHAASPTVRIIGLSMFEEPRQAAAMREAGAAAYLSKTASVETLLEAIRQGGTQFPAAPRPRRKSVPH